MNSEISLFFIVWSLCLLRNSEANDAYNSCNFETVHRSCQLNSQHSIKNHSSTNQYLGLHLDNKLNWKGHIVKKRKQMDLRHKELYWLLGRKSRLSVDNKLLLYKSIIAPIWT